MMIKIGTITYQGAQNFGSVLQTYALQEFICNLIKDKKEEYIYKVINFRTDCQKELYSVYKKNNKIQNIIKNIFAFKYHKSLNQKKYKFELFLKNFINLTKEVNCSGEILQFSQFFDYYISGSDQIWNVRATDFEDEYFLNFVKSGHKISYAASMGPLDINWNDYGKQKYSDLLNEYDSISVREIGTAEKVEFLIGKKPEINIDPTFLLNKEDWRKIESDANYNNGKYILLYCLEPSKEQLEIAKAISKKLRLPILITKYNNKNDIINGFIKKYDSGPLDFLSYVDNATLVLSSSFHGTAFSMIYNKPFYVFNGMKDSRISSILKIADIEDRPIDSLADIKKVSLDPVDFTTVNEIIKKEQARSKGYFIKALEL